MSDRTPREEAIDVLYEHRPNGIFDCACGWRGNGFGDRYRAHVLDALTLPSSVRCETCLGHGVVPAEGQSFEHGADPCPDDCKDGTVSVPPLLRWNEPRWIDTPEADALYREE